MRLVQLTRRSLSSPLDRFVDDFFGDLAAPHSPRATTVPAAVLQPRVDLRDDDDVLLVAIELPGLAEADVELTIEKDRLRVKGEKKRDARFLATAEGDASDATGARPARVYSERTYGRFERVVALPEDADRDHVRASFRDGVLEIVVPKAQAADRSPRKIAINA